LEIDVGILVTGGAGYIGGHMVHELTDAGEDVVVLDNLSTGFHWALPSETELVVGDVGDETLVKEMVKTFQIDAIIHFAGSIIVPESVTDPLRYYLNNTVKSRALIAAAVDSGIKRFIFSSTAAVYGSPATVPVNEAAPLQPMSPYGSSKLMTEIMLADTAAAHDFRYVTLRYFNVAGADPAGRTGQSTKGATHLLKVACETALGKRKAMEVFGADYPTRDGTCVRDYIHVTDLARAHVAALKYLKGGGTSGIFNCGYSRGFSVLEVIDAVQRVLGRDFTVIHSARRAGDPAEIVADSTKIRTILNWSPQYDALDGIVANALAWEDRLTNFKANSTARTHPLGNTGIGNNKTCLSGFSAPQSAEYGWPPA
jgi:UDP-glucose 4-epimerase